MRVLELVSVNVGEVRSIEGAKASGKTGIYKVPISTPVAITAFGLQGDAIVDTENHGGLDQAVYVFTMPDYAWWTSHLGFDLAPGTFGENLTLSDLESATLCIGDRFRVGPVLLEITSPRVPCVTIAARMKDPKFVRKFRNAERPGFYCRVLETGRVQCGDPVEWIPFPAGTEGLVSVLESFLAFYKQKLTDEELRRFLNVPIHRKDRQLYEELLLQQCPSSTVPRAESAPT
jgi:MOSC domain-containing protein YiiM